MKKQQLCTFSFGSHQFKLCINERDWFIFINYDNFLPASNSLADIISTQNNIPYATLAGLLTQIVKAKEMGRLYSYDYQASYKTPSTGLKFLDFDVTLHDNFRGSCFCELYRNLASREQYFCGRLDLREYAFSGQVPIDGVTIKAKRMKLYLFEELSKLLNFIQIKNTNFDDIIITEKTIT